MRRTIPVAVTCFVGLVQVVDYFFKMPVANSIATMLRTWGVIVATFSLGLGAVNLMMLHTARLQARKTKNWIHSAALVASLVLTALFGLAGGQSSKAFNFMYEAIIQPVNTAVFSMLAFFLGSASYRAFRARNTEATILLVVGVIVLLGQVPIGQVMFPSLTSASTWIMSYLNVAGQRGVIIASGIAFFGLSLRVILGIERSYLGGSQ